MALCRRCGLCCDGTLFAWVTVRAAELPALRGHRLPVLQREDGSHAIRQPCAALCGKDCTVYADRPLPCRQFRCQQLIALEEGEVDLAEALRVVDRASEAIAELAARAASQGARDSENSQKDSSAGVEAAPPGNPVAALRTRAAAGNLHADCAEALRRVEALLARDFLGRARRA